MAFVPSQTIEDELADCYMLANMANRVVDGSNAAQKIGAEIFNSNFTTCLNVKFPELEDCWKTYRYLNVAEARITL